MENKQGKNKINEEQEDLQKEIKIRSEHEWQMLRREQLSVCMYVCVYVEDIESIQARATTNSCKRSLEPL